MTNLLSPMRLVRAALAELLRAGDLASGPSPERNHEEARRIVACVERVYKTNKARACARAVWVMV